MKKLIVTGCTLILSLIGAFGVNKNSTDLANQMNTNTTIDTNLAVEEQDSTEATENIEVVAEEADSNGSKKSQSPEDKMNIDTNVDKEVVKETKIEAAKDKKNEANDTKVEATEVGPTKKEEAQPEVAKKTEAKQETEALQETALQETTKQNTASQDNSKQVTDNQMVQQVAQKNEVKTNDATVNQLDSNDIIVKQNNSTYQNTCVIQGGKIIVYNDGAQLNNQMITEIINQCNQRGGTISNNNLQDIIASLQGQNKVQSNDTTQNTQNTQNQNNNKQGTTTPSNNTQNTNQGSTTQNTTTNTSNQSSLSNYASEVIRLVNAERAKQGLAALTTNNTITAAANKRAVETKTSFSHTRPNGTSFSTVLGEYGISYRTSGENIAYGQRTPQEVVTGWMNSEGHRRNIMNSSFGTIGVGVYQDANGTIYWSQLFTN